MVCHARRTYTPTCFHHSNSALGPTLSDSWRNCSLSMRSLGASVANCRFLGKWHARMPLCMNSLKIKRKRAPPANSLCTRRRLDRPRFEITHRATIRMVVGTCRLVWFALPAQLPAPSGRLRLQECNACRQYEGYTISMPCMPQISASRAAELNDGDRMRPTKGWKAPK